MKTLNYAKQTLIYMPNFPYSCNFRFRVISEKQLQDSTGASIRKL